MGQEYQEYKTNLDYIVMEDPSQQESSMHLKRQKKLYICGQKPKVMLWKSPALLVHILTALISQVISGWSLSSMPTKGISVTSMFIETELAGINVSADQCFTGSHRSMQTFGSSNKRVPFLACRTYSESLLQVVSVYFCLSKKRGRDLIVQEEMRGLQVRLYPILLLSTQSWFQGQHFHQLAMDRAVI